MNCLAEFKIPQRINFLSTLKHELQSQDRARTFLLSPAHKPNQLYNNIQTNAKEHQAFGPFNPLVAGKLMSRAAGWKEINTHKSWLHTGYWVAGTQIEREAKRSLEDGGPLFHSPALSLHSSLSPPVPFLSSHL